MNFKNGMAPVHPGEILRDELAELGMSARALARSIKVPVNRITAILNGERGVTADTARRLSRYFGTSTEFWMNLQKSYEIRAAELADPQNSVDEIVPRKTALLRDAVRDLPLETLPSQRVTEILKTIECNLTLGTQLQTYEQMARIGDLNPAMVHTYEAPLEEIRDAGVFETGLAEFLPYTLESLDRYQNQFRSPSTLERQRLEAEFAKSAANAFLSPHPMLENLDCAWLNELAELASMQRLFDLQYIGKTVIEDNVFSSLCSDSLRRLLGDWREEIAWPKSIWTDLGARLDFYQALGFDVNLTNVPSTAFHEILGVTGIRSEPPSLIEAYGPSFQSKINPNEERALQRTNKAHDWIQRLESQFRHFIDRTMTEVFGSDWTATQLPRKTIDTWTKRQKRDARRNAITRSLLAYAHFTDYETIICQQENWDLAFSSTFLTQESVRESLQRLYPIRNDTMHGRPISKEDELLLYVETKRFLGAIESTDYPISTSPAKVVFTATG